MEDESRVRAKLQGENRNLQAELEQLREQVSLIRCRTFPPDMFPPPTFPP